jgi:hypothetical protein
MDGVASDGAAAKTPNLHIDDRRRARRTEIEV